MENGRHSGTVANVLPNGCTFIKRSEGGKDVFAHISAYPDLNLDEVQIDMPVTFRIGPDPKNPERVRAEEVRLNY